MANSLTTNPIYLDTFSAAINIASSLGYATGTPLRIHSIEWSNGTTAGDTALITDAVGGVPVFSETLDVAKKSIIKYYGGLPVKNLCIAISGIATGNVQIILA